MDTKICKTCKIEKKYSEFHKIKTSRDGVRTVCKECRKEEKKEYLSRDYVLKKHKTFYQDNKVRIRKYLNQHYWTITGQYHGYKKSAKKRNLKFDLTKNDCIPFYKTKCHYCGGDIKGMGIDRVDNKIGYELGNIVPCCSKCNFMKLTMTKNEFIEHIKQIIQFLKIKN